MNTKCTSITHDMKETCTINVFLANMYVIFSDINTHGFFISVIQIDITFFLFASK